MFIKLRFGGLFGKKHQPGLEKKNIIPCRSANQNSDNTDELSNGGMADAYAGVGGPFGPKTQPRLEKNSYFFCFVDQSPSRQAQSLNPCFLNLGNFSIFEIGRMRPYVLKKRGKLPFTKISAVQFVVHGKWYLER